ncbi:hypothetical protein Sjap_025783 [Stephania japonica]|uniref:HTH myb-type domain-containing protein n=1 Tax=Stephania japonica TaxID=461633 RepID=A0AAP0E5T4_9MAGN
MLAVSPLIGCNKDEREEEADLFSIGGEEFSCGSLLDSIDFDDIFIGFGDGDVLPDLEMDSADVFGEFSISGGEESELNVCSDHHEMVDHEEKNYGGNCNSGSVSTTSNLNSNSNSSSSLGDQEILSKRVDDEHEIVNKEDNPTTAVKEDDVKARKSGNQQGKGAFQGKRKVKVDWTPELHRRFVQAVEQLGMDKAVPSRILEIMGIDCLTRHNIASHLQKYRSHQKHLRAREAEAANWNQRRQIYGGAKRPPEQQHHHHQHPHMNPWIAPTMGFPPPASTSLQPFRPLHVWGHPPIDHPMMHMWPKHLAPPHSPSPHQPPWAPPPPTSLAQPHWQHHLHHQRVPNAVTPGTPCFPQALAPRFPAPPVPGIPPPQAMYKVEQQSIGVPSPPQSDFQPPFDHFQPTKESIDAAIGDALSKPWLPLPLGLKPPSLDSVMVELQRQGIPNIPPATTASA